jgi:valyl-tRNA synthetase
VWDDFCDWYIELSKSGKPGENMSKDQLTRALSMFEQLMKLLHPFMPFISEEIWQRIKDRSTEEALIQTQWPLVKKDQYQPEKEQLFGVIKKLVSGIRNIRAEMNISPKEPLTVFIKTESKELAEQLISSEWVLKKLETIEELTIGTDIEKPQAAASAVISGNELIIPLKGLIDLDKEREKIEKEIQRLEGFLKGIEKKLSNSKFVDNAPQDVVERERKKQSDTLSTLEKLKNNLADFLS